MRLAVPGTSHMYSSRARVCRRWLAYPLCRHSPPPDRPLAALPHRQLIAQPRRRLASPPRRRGYVLHVIFLREIQTQVARLCPVQSAWHWEDAAVDEPEKSAK
jgi:hypothetical protein